MEDEDGLDETLPPAPAQDADPAAGVPATFVGR